MFLTVIPVRRASSSIVIDASPPSASAPFLAPAAMCRWYKRECSIKRCYIRQCKGNCLMTMLSTLVQPFLPLAHDEPAGGAALDQVAIATGMGIAGFAAIGALCYGHRT